MRKGFPAYRVLIPDGQNRAKESVLASEAPEQSARDRHQLRTLLYAITVLVLVLLAVVMTILAARQLNRYPFRIHAI